MYTCLYIINQDCQVKMAGYWPSLSFFFCVFVGRDEETKKNDANIFVAGSKRQIRAGKMGPSCLLG